MPFRTLRALCFCAVLFGALSASSANEQTARVRPSPLAPPLSQAQYQEICTASMDELEAKLVRGFEQMRTVLGDLYDILSLEDRRRLAEIYKKAKAEKSVSPEMEREEIAIWRRLKAHPNYIPRVRNFFIGEIVEATGTKIEFHDLTLSPSAVCFTGEVLCSSTGGFRIDAKLTPNDNIWGGTVRLHLTQSPDDLESGVLDPRIVSVLPDGTAGVAMHGGDAFRIRGFVQRVFRLGCGHGERANRWQPKLPQSFKLPADPRTRID